MDHGLLARAEAVRRRPLSKEYYAVRAPYDRAIDLIQAGDPEGVEDVLTFLLTRPRFHGSGYMTEKMLQFISRPPLDQRQLAVVIAVAESIASDDYRRECRAAANLLVRLGVDGWTAREVSEEYAERRHEKFRRRYPHLFAVEEGAE